MMKEKLQARMDIDDVDMGFLNIVLALEYTRVYVKYNFDNLPEINDEILMHPILGLPFGVAKKLSDTTDAKEAFLKAIQVMDRYKTDVASAVLSKLNKFGLQVYKDYGLEIKINKLTDDEQRIGRVLTYLRKWSSVRTGERNSVDTLFEFIVSIFYCLAQEKEIVDFDARLSKMLMFANSVLSSQNELIENIEKMPFDAFVERLNCLKFGDSFMEAMLTEYLDMANRGYSCTIL